mmetsp:Transcript_27364/g.78856  ORF Transcript_27364/g.78856 Transcript_27364/m.78856 type:complete len:228 (-) Transcript_27364:482-1165(-)
MLATFCGGNSQRRATSTSASLEKSGVFETPTVAKAQAILESSCGLKECSKWSLQAASAKARKSGVSCRRTRAKAQAVFAMPWVDMIGAAATSSREKLVKSAGACTRMVPKAQMIVVRHCGLNSPCRRPRRCCATPLKKASSPTESFAKDQRRFESSNGFISPRRPLDAATTRSRKATSRNRSIAQDQQMMLKHRISLDLSSDDRWTVHWPSGAMLEVMCSTSACLKL